MIHRKDFKRHVFVLLVLILSLSPLASVLAVTLPDTVWVDLTYDETTLDFGFTRFNEIPDALAAVAPGGTVHVAAGTYYGFFVDKSGVSVIGANGAVIDGTANGEVQTNDMPVGIHVSAPNVVIQGFTVQNWLGGIYVSDCTGVLHDEPYLQTLDPVIEMNVTISNNTVAGNEDGIIVFGNGNVISNNTVNLNSSTGIIAIGENCSITGNSVYGNEYEGIGWRGSGFTISGNHSNNNMLGMYAEGGFNSQISNNQFSDGEAGIVLYGAGNSITNNYVLDNDFVGIYSVATSDIGLRIDNGDDPVPELNNFQGNVITGNGGTMIKPAQVNTLSNKYSIQKISEDGGGIFSSPYNKFRRNHIADNMGYGLYVMEWYDRVGTKTELPDPEPEPVDAALNWWGHTSGPYHSESNPFASGQEVSDFAIYSPWLLAEPSAPEPVDTVTDYLPEGNSISIEDAISARVTSGEGTVTIGQYNGNPTDKNLFGSIGFYGDVYVTSPHEITELVVYLFYTGTPDHEEELVLHWFDGTQWVACSDSGVDTQAKYVWAVIRMDTVPTLSDLTGTEFGAGLVGEEDPGGPTVPDDDEELPHTGGLGLTAYGLVIAAVGFSLNRKKRI